MRVEFFRLTFPRTTSLLFPLRLSSRRQQTSSFCCRGKLSPSELLLWDDILSPYTSDRTRATWGRLTRPAEEGGNKGRGKGVSNQPRWEAGWEGKRKILQKLTLCLWVCFRFLLPLVRLHHLNCSPATRDKQHVLKSLLRSLDCDITATEHDQSRNMAEFNLDWVFCSPVKTSHLQMSRALRASPDTADTFLAQNWTAEASRISWAAAWEQTFTMTFNTATDVWMLPSLLPDPYLCESVLYDGRQLLTAVRGEVQQLWATTGLSLEPGQDTVGQVECVSNT